MPRRYLSASTARPTPSTRPIGTVSRANFTVTQRACWNSLLRATSTYWSHPFDVAVVALRVAAHLAEPDRPPERVHDEHRQDHERRGRASTPRRQVAPAGHGRPAVTPRPNVGERARLGWHGRGRAIGYAARAGSPAVTCPSGARADRAGRPGPRRHRRRPGRRRAALPGSTTAATGPTRDPPSRRRAVNRGRAVAVAAGGIGLGALAATAGRRRRHADVRGGRGGCGS